MIDALRTEGEMFYILSDILGVDILVSKNTFRPDISLAKPGILRSSDGVKTSGLKMTFSKMDARVGKTGLIAIVKADDFDFGVVVVIPFLKQIDPTCYLITRKEDHTYHLWSSVNMLEWVATMDKEGRIIKASMLVPTGPSNKKEWKPCVVSTYVEQSLALTRTRRTGASAR